jgi:hypothetical protein
MKNKAIIILLLLAACERAEELTPRLEPENVYGDHTLPQGNHDYDDYIVEFLDKYNTLILYKYAPHDIYWNVTNNIVRPVEYDSAGQVAVAGYLDTPADEAYIGQQLELTREKFLRHYPDDFLLRMLPKKILLVNSFVSLTVAGVATNQAPFSGYDYLLFPWGGPGILTITPAEVNDFRARASDIFLRRLVNNGKITRDPTFLSISDYATPGSTNAAKIANGFIAPSATSQADDWAAYVQAIVSNPYDTLVAPRGDIPLTDFVNRRGLLTPEYDTGGRIRRKYDAMIAYFRDEHGIDLQAIGNDHEE